MTDIIETVKKEVYERSMKDTNPYGIGAWTHHILKVYEVATEIYKEYNADYEIVALAALLHDVAAVTSIDYAEEHHIIGAQIADEILSGFNYDRNKIELIKKCILNHRGSVVMEKLTGEEVCIADADAMAHFYSIESLFSMVYKEKGMSIDEANEFIMGKLERSYSKLSDIGKKQIEERYAAAKITFGSEFKNTYEDFCAADADALAHFYSIASLFNMVYIEQEKGIDEGSDFIMSKLEKSYSELSDIGKKQIEERYAAAKLILGRKL